MRPEAHPCLSTHPAFEPLETRLLLSGLYVSGLVPTGGADHPFQSVRLQFNQPVQDGSFTDTDATLTGPGGPLTTSVSRVDATTYDLLCAEANALASYTLILGLDILDQAGQPMDQDHNGTPGQASDVYRARLSADGLTLTEANTAYDGYNLVLYGGQSTITGTHPLGSLELLGGAVLAHAASTETQTAGMALSITDGLVIDAASRIDVTAKGYLYGRTHGNTLADGHATAYWGGSYGGLGYNGYTVTWGAGISPPVETYGDFRDPTEPGAGGYGWSVEPGGSGGGWLRISAASAVIDGMILADGGQAKRAGAGGGVRLDVGTLSGGGWISTSGGNVVQSDADPLNGGGGGGRVALYYQTLNGFDLSHIMCVGGNMDDANAGAPGTIYIEQVGQAGQLRVDSRNLPNDMWTPLGDPADAEVTVPELVLNGQNTRVKPEHQMPVRATNLTLTNGAVLSHLAATETAVYSLDITVSGTLTIDAASKIDASGAGYLPGRTQGNTLDEGGWGGGYGGLMYDYGADHDNSYGDFRDPAEPGSGERPGVSGGGLIRLSVATAVIDGAIVAAGDSWTSGGHSYGGSGGGIRIDAGTLRGSGIIAADGTSDCGGGRVAIYYDALDGFSLDKVTAFGGVNGTHYGSAGTVYLEQTGQDPTLLIRGRESGSAMWTPLGDASDNAVSVANVVIEGPGVVAKPQHQMPIEAQNVTLGHGATLSHLASTETQTYSLDLQVSGALTVDAESKIDVSGAGYGQSRTSGNTTADGATEYSGGSYGGLGGDYNVGGMTGWTPNPVYGDFRNPDEPGSGGAGHDRYWGGRGGGLARISAGSAVIDGAILAIGGESQGGGAGSGGGVWIDVGTLSGTGTISADGGASDWGGGGGGGRVAVYYNTLSGFDLGHLQALAGDGPWQTPGSAGTVYLKQTGQADTLVIDNQDRPAEHWTPLGVAADNEFSVDNLVIRGPNTVAKPEHQMPIRAASVTLSNGAVLSHLAATGDEMYWLDLQVSGTLQVDAGAKIDATNLGYLPGHSMGNSTYGGSALSGGSYGGYGYNFNSMMWGSLKSDGRTYGDYRNPTEPGAGGGRNGWDPMSGGGLVRITAATVILNGAIVADGGSTVRDSSEATGSGGGIRLDVGSLSGSGAISANGGDTRGYAGGGGRVAVYYDALDGFDLDRVSAASGISTPGWNAHWAGSPGTVYFQQTGQKGLLSIDNKGREAGFTTPLGQAFEDEFTADNLVVNGLGVTVEPQHSMPIRVDNLTLSNGARMTHPAATETEEYSLDLRVAGQLSIDATSGINVSGKGYLAGYTDGNRNVVSTGGGSYGGRGGGDSLPTYGDPNYPNSLGSGAGAAPNNFTYPGVGGGLVTITARSLILDGFIWADGMDSGGQNSPGGAGGGIRINVGTLSGTGEVHALGGNGYNGGGGGRIAIYTWNSRDFPPAHVRAAGGLNVDTSYGNTHQPGEAGTVTYPAAGFYWPGAEGRLYHDTERIRWDVLGIDPSTVIIDMTVSHDGQTVTVAAGASAAEAIPWDTTAGTDGQYQLHAIFRASGGQILAERTQTVTVFNAVGWHKGLIVDQQTWSANRVHVVQGDLEIAGGAGVTVEPGAIVKFGLNSRIIIDKGGTFDAPATTANPIIFTCFTDDTVGGDTNQDGSATQPKTGDWAGFLPMKGATVNFTTHVEMRFITFTHSGVLAQSEIWPANCTHYVTKDLVVPSGTTLIIQPGAIIKMGSRVNIFVAPGGTLTAQGSNSLSIIFTSYKDDSVGGDTNEDGQASSPASGDWSAIDVDGAASLDHVQMRYGAGTGGAWGHMGSLRLGDTAAEVTLSNSLIADSFYDGIVADAGHLTVTSSILVRNDRGIFVGMATVDVVNSTFDGNRIGLMGAMTVANSLVTNSETFGVRGAATLRYSDVWAPVNWGSVNYEGTDQTGQNGNISADPKYRDADNGDYSLNYLSPAIDAADGALAPASDARGRPRYNDPRTANSGAPAGNDFVDMGAMEFAESAPSNVDLVIGDVTGPTQASVGDEVLIQWTVTNAGTAPAHGPWHDAVYLALNGKHDSFNVWLAAEPVEAEGLVLQPGQGYMASAKVIVPAGYEGRNFWEVVANSRGDLFEGANRQNNTADAAAAVELTYPELTVGGPPAVGQFAGSGKGQWFILRPDRAGQNIKLTLDLAGNGITELYVSQGRPVSRTSFDRTSAAIGQADQKLQISDARLDQPYYVLAYPVSTTAKQSFTLTVAEAIFGIDQVSPATGGNVGNVTLGIQGESIPRDVLPVLVAADGAKYYGGNLYYVDSSLAYATFELVGAAVGSYDLRLIAPDGSFVTRQGAFQVTAGIGGDLEAQIILPALIRAGRPYTFQIEYKNVGDTDMYSPILRLSTSDQRKLGLTPEQQDGLGELVFLGYSSTGPAGILQPGDVELVTVYSTAGKGDSGMVEYSLTSQPVDPLHPRLDAIHWSSLAAKYAVPGGSSNPLWQTFMAQMGYTWDELTAHLGERLTEQVKSGIPVDPVVDHQMQRAFAAALSRGSGLSDTDNPWILSVRSAPPILDGLDLIFSKAIDVASFTADDIVLAGPESADITITQISDRVFHIGFSRAGEGVTLETRGAYTFSVGPDIADPSGLLLDQDRDGIAGEAVDDTLVTSFNVQSIHTLSPILHVAGQNPSGPVDAATGTGLGGQPGLVGPLAAPYDHPGIDHVTIQFSRPVQFLTFTPRDVSITGPDGAVPVTAVHQAGEKTWEIEFPRQQALGQYTVKVGTDIRDLEDFPLDQDLDGLGGQGDQDLYTGTFSLVDIHGPRVIAQTPQDVVFEATDHFDVTFSEPLDAATLTAATVTLTGPDGPIAVTGVLAQGGATCRISFAAMETAGWYQWSIGPGVTDAAGNAMDQDQDGANGTPADVYAGEVLLAVDPQTNLIIDDPGWMQMMLARMLADDGDPVDKVQIRGTVIYGGLVKTSFSVPQAKVELWEVQGTLDKYPGNPEDGDLRDKQITTVNSRTRSSYLNDKGEYLFDSTLFSSPLLRLDASGNPRQFYVVVVAENDYAAVYDWGKREFTDPHEAAYKEFDPKGDGSRWAPKAVVASAAWATGADQPGDNTEVHTINLTVSSDLFAPLEWVKMGSEQFKSDFGEKPRGKISVVAPVGPSNAFYNGNSDVIVLGSDEFNRPATILHEFGHAIQRSRGENTTTQALYGVVQESTAVQQVPGTNGWIEIQPPVYRSEVAYCEGWASFVAAYTLRHQDIWDNEALADNVDVVRSRPDNLNHNDWWMGYDAFGFTENADADDSVKAKALAAAFADPFNGANLNANTGDVVMGAVLSTFWQIANGGPMGAGDLWSAFNASIGTNTDIMDFWNVLPHRPAYMTVFLDNGMTLSDNGNPVDDPYELNDTRDAAALLTPMTDLSGNLLGPISLDGLIMAESVKGFGDWFAFNVTGDQFAVPDQKRCVSIQLDWQERYGDLDIFAQNETTGEMQDAVLRREPDGHVLLAFRGLDAAEDYHFVVGISGYGAINPDGTPRDSGGDFVPSYSLTVDWGGLPQPDDDDKPDPDDPHPWPPPPHTNWPEPEDNDRKPEGGSHDPNAMVGPAGAGSQGYIPAGQPMPYTVFFENSGPDATLPAQEVFIDNPLDADLDPATFALTEIVFNNHTVTVPPQNARYFKTTLDLRPAENLLVEIEAGLDEATGNVFCNLRSLDPVTHDLPLDPTAGLLPVNDANHSGEGHVSYVIHAKTGLPTGTQITNQAGIVFDINPAIATNTALNTLDGSVPNSGITTPSGSVGSGTIKLVWWQSDTGSGIASTELYASDNGGAYSQVWQGQGSGYTFHAQPDHTYRFYTITTDAAGNREAAPDQPDATLAIWPTEQKVLDAKKGKWSFADEDGTPVTVSWTGKGTATIERWKNPADGRGNIRAITVEGSDAASGLAIATTGKNADTQVEAITVHGPIGSIAAATTDLVGSLTIDGALGKLTLDEVTGAAIQIGGSPTSKPVTLVFDQVKDTGILSAMPIASLTATEWLDTDGVLQEIKAPWIGTLSIPGKTTVTPKIAGDLAANLTLSGSGLAAKAKTLGAATIKGSVRASTWDITGAVGAIKASGDAGVFGQPWVIRNAASVASLTLGNVTDAEVGAGTIGAIKAVRWFNGSITANTLASIATTGMAAAKMMPAFPGNFGADLRLSGAGLTGTAKALGGATIKGNLMPSTWDITGPVGALTVTGNVGFAGQPWILKNSSILASLTLGDVADAEVQGATKLGPVKAVRWQAGKITANTAASITTTGLAATKTAAAVPGDFAADVTLAGAGVTAKTKSLGAVSIKRSVTAGAWNVTGAIGTVAVGGDFQGSVALSDSTGQVTLTKMNVLGKLLGATITSTGALGTITVGAVENSTVTAGDLAAQHRSIGGFSAKGLTGVANAFINSNVQAYTLGTIVIKTVKTDNGLTTFGVKGHYVASYVRDAQKAKTKVTGPQDPPIDAAGNYLMDLVA